MSYACLMPFQTLTSLRSSCEIQLQRAQEKCGFESCLQIVCNTERDMTRYPALRLISCSSLGKTWYDSELPVVLPHKRLNPVECLIRE
jgi:hypothetical protein